MTWRYREEYISFVFSDVNRAGDMKERCGMKKGMIHRIQGDAVHQGYDLSDWV